MNKLILGTVQFGIPYGINNQKGKPSSEQVSEMLHYAYENGVRFLDTAEAYGEAHSIIGNFHRINTSKQFNIITKFPNIKVENIENKLVSYLEELCVSNIYALLFHSFETYKENRNFIEKLLQFKSKGIIKNIGVSIYTNEQFEIAIEDNSVDIIQFPFNLFDNLHQRGKLINLAKSKNKIMHTRSVFLQGLFFMPLSSDLEVVKKLNSPLKSIQKLAIKTGLSIQNIALTYCLNQPNIDNVLIGVDDIEQLKINLSGLENSLDNSILSVIDNIKIKNIDLINPSLWNL